jgi:hypothetical protein
MNHAADVGAGNVPRVAVLARIGRTRSSGVVEPFVDSESLTDFVGSKLPVTRCQAEGRAQ